MSNIRNFCIIAHIDHGKSTLADRILQITGLVNERQMRNQYLDRMELERERGITIKSQAVKMNWSVDEKNYILNMIDTPGHVDFSYEVSRSIIACEAAILLIDATQGIEAQTVANLYMALEHNLTIIPVLNKIDLPAAKTEIYGKEIANLLGINENEVLHVSGKTGKGVENLLNQIIKTIKPPKINTDAKPKALIFDSEYNIYKGIITYVRVVDGVIRQNETVKIMSSGKTHELIEIGVMSPEPVPVKALKSGEVGYVITGVKDVRQAKVGGTITSAINPAIKPLKGFDEPKPMVYTGFFPVNGDSFPVLRDALEKLKLNDASLDFITESSSALGFGFRCGFLGLLHMEIIFERLIREFDLDLITTSPNTMFDVITEDNKKHLIKNPSNWPTGKIQRVYEPVVNASIIAPKEYTGAVMELCQEKRGSLKNMEYLSEKRVQLNYKLPLMEIIFDFFNTLKSRTKGYASFDYELIDKKESADLIQVSILLSGDKVDAFSQIVHRNNAYKYGNKICKKLSEIIPKQQFQIPIQAAIGSKIIARENIKALRKDVLAKCYGGDITRKRKLLEKQKEGKKRMKMIGKIEIPNDTFIKILSNNE